MKIGNIIFLWTFLFSAGTLHADTIYLNENLKGNQGEVIEEYPDAIIIRFPKTEIKRIEADEQPALKQGSASQKVIWIEDGDTITLRLPKQTVQVSGSEDMNAIVQGGSSSFSVGPEGRSASPFPQLALNPSDRVIQGKVYFKSEPLENCKVRILKRRNSSKDSLLNLFDGSVDSKKVVSYEAVTDKNGIYSFTNVPYGEYTLYWQPKWSQDWIRRLSEYPDIMLVPGRPIAVRDIETNVKTVN